MDEAIQFSAQVFKVATTINGGIRLTLDLSAADTVTITQIINAKRPGILLECACLAVNSEKEVNVSEPKRRINKNPTYAKP